MSLFESRSANSLNFEEVGYEKADWLATITIDRPARYNAYSTRALEELAAAFRDASFDDAVGVIVLTGSGKTAFCTGGDVREYQAEYTARPRDYWKYMRLFRAYIESIVNSGKPVIARINGMAVGGGNESQAACDLAVMAEHAWIGQVGTRVGSVAAGGATQWLPILIGDRRAREMVFLNDRIPARQALEWGLVNRVAPSVTKDGEFVTGDPPRLAENAVDEFLFETRSGFCEHYAAAFTMVMRAAGVPARIVTGYQGGEFNPLGGYLLVRQSDAHAWSEIWVAGRGWLRVDPTAAVAPDRIERGVGASVADAPALTRIWEDSRLVSQAQLLWDYVNDFWNERIVRFDARMQFSLLQRLGIDEPDWRTLGLGLTAVLAAFFVGLSAWLAWSFRAPQRDWPERLHRQAAVQLARRGIVRRAAEGPVDYLERAAAHCPDLRVDLLSIRELYVALRYGPAPADEDLRLLKYRVGRLRP